MNKTGFIIAGWDCIILDPVHFVMWRLECFVIHASRWHTSEFHLLGMRPQTATHNNNPRTLSWTFLIFERQKSVRLDLRAADRQINAPQEGVQCATSINGLQHRSQIWCSAHAKVPQDSLTALQEQRLEQPGNNRSAGLQLWRQVQQPGCKDTHQQDKKIMYRNSILAESTFWKPCRWWTSGRLTLLWHEFQHDILSKIN